MTILIKDAATDRLVRELAQGTGESIADAVRQDAWERLQRVPMNEGEDFARTDIAPAWRR